MSIQIVCCMGRKPDEKKEPWYILRHFLSSCAKYKFTPVVLGDGPDEFKGLLSKAKLLKRAIENGKITADHIIFTDSFDVVFVEDPHRIIEGFQDEKKKRENHPVVIWNAERACFSDASLAKDHPPTKYSYKYLNSGWGCGETAGFHAALKELDPETLPDDHQKPDGKMHHSCDQDYWMRRFLFGSVPIGIDSEARLCQTFCNVTKQDISLMFTGKVKNLETGTFPMTLHFNGGSKNDIMPVVLNHMGYRYP